MRLAVVGTGATGAHCARTLRRLLPHAALTLIDWDHGKAQALASSLEGEVGSASSLETAPLPSVVVLCVPAGLHGELASGALALGCDVVSVADAIDDLQGLLELDELARKTARRVVVGAGFSPGLSCILARHAATLFDEVEEIHIAKSGTGGPACAHQHHRALPAVNWEWRDGRWIRRRGSSGRRLVWFPGLVGARDCYRAGLAEPFLLQRSFPDATRLTARMAATRRDRLTGLLPMLRRPHADGGPGGLRVEVWGRRDGVMDVVVYGAADHPALVAGTMAATAVDGLAKGWFPDSGVFGVGQCLDPAVVLAAVSALGVHLAVFEGAA